MEGEQGAHRASAKWYRHGDRRILSKKDLMAIELGPYTSAGAMSARSVQIGASQ